MNGTKQSDNVKKQIPLVQQSLFDSVLAIRTRARTQRGELNALLETAGVANG